MSRLVLVRHAKSDYPWGVGDHDRPLNDRGRRDAPQVGHWLDEHIDWEPGAEPVVVVSTARRAQLTWAHARAAMSDRWDAVTVRDEPRVYEAPVAELRAVAAEAAELSDTVLMVGHNPGLAGLILTVAAPDAMRDEATAKYPTAAIAVLHADIPLVDALREQSGFRVREFAVPRG